MSATGFDVADGAVLVTIPGGLWLAGQASGSRPQKEVALRAVDSEDEVFVLDTADGPPSQRATALLARCLRDGEEVARALTVGDREALLLHLRRLTIGDRMDCVLRCPAETCGERMELGLAASSLLLAPYPDPLPTYELRVDEGGRAYAVTFRLPTAADLDIAASLARTDPASGAAAILRDCVLSASRDGVPIDARELPEPVTSALNDTMSARDPQAELELDVRCPSCGRAFSAMFDTATFFLRELEQRAVRLLQEVHALALHYHWSETEILRMSPRRRARYLELVSDAQTRAHSR